ncbi:MAG: hypothetical protein R3325_01360 [Thermoanaerobaculia bacterium]|nr:hypothetical protein [Thermoanaerobaculia bacterium]
MSPARRRLPLLLVLLLPVAPAAGAATPPGAALPVSPGEPGRLGPGALPCPTFSWAPAAAAVEQRLLVFRLHSDRLPLATSGAGAEEWLSEPAVSRPLPPGASSWTAAASDCLTPGASYAWIVGWADDGRSWSWSEPLLFRVAGGDAAGRLPLPPLDTAAPVIAGAGDGATGGPAREEAAPKSALREPGVAPPATTASLGAALAALRAEQANPTGDTAGLVGTVASSAGAGLIAGNLAPGGGADLLLDGASQGLADTALTESGVDRSHPADQVFDIGNSGAGGMTLTVDGAAVLFAPVAAGQIDAGAVGSSEIADGSVTAGDLDPALALSDGQVADDLTVSGGSIEATPVGAVTPDTGAFTDLAASGAVSLGGGGAPLTVTASNLGLDAAGELTVTGSIVAPGALDLSPATGMDFNIGPASSLDVFVDGVRELQVSSSGNINTGPNSAARRSLRVSRVENDGAGLDLVLQASGSGQVHINDTLRLDAGETLGNSGSVITLASGGLSELAFDLGSPTPELASPTGMLAVTDTLVVDDVLRLVPVDSDGGGVSPVCDAGALGALYYDEDEEALCLCTVNGGAPTFLPFPTSGSCD